MYAKITELKEYYLTRAEQEVFETYANDMVKSHLRPRSTGDDEVMNIIELGAGDGRKTEIFLKALLSQKVKFEYIPVDISRKAMTDLLHNMKMAFLGQTVRVHGFIGDYLECLKYISSKFKSRKTAVLFIGSSIGNCTLDEADSFLQSIRSKLKPKDVLLLGTDLRKDIQTMRSAYSDAAGITKEFNLNVLRRSNGTLGTNFDVNNFEHVAVYNSLAGCMESYLVCTRSHQVSMRPGKYLSARMQTNHGNVTSLDFMFQKSERIHMEHSYKYTPAQVCEILQKAGFEIKDQYFDSREWFVDTISVVSDVEGAASHCGDVSPNHLNLSGAKGNGTFR